MPCPALSLEPRLKSIRDLIFRAIVANHQLHQVFYFAIVLGRIESRLGKILLDHFRCIEHFVVVVIVASVASLSVFKLINLDGETRIRPANPRVCSRHCRARAGSLYLLSSKIPDWVQWLKPGSSARSDSVLRHNLANCRRLWARFFLCRALFFHPLKNHASLCLCRYHRSSC